MAPSAKDWGAVYDAHQQQRAPQGVDWGAVYDQHQAASGGATLEGAANELAQGATFGLSDEIDARIASLSPVLRNALSKTGLVSPTSTTMDEAYNQRLGEVRQQTKDFEASNPGSALALQIAGGLPYAGIGAGMQGVKGAAAAGAGFGAAYGFGTGEGGLENRIANAAQGGVAGGVLGGGIAAGLGALGAGVKRVSDTGIGQRIGDILDSERGSVSRKQAKQGLSEADAMIAKRLAGLGDDQLDDAARAMKGNRDMFLAESFGMTGNRPKARRATEQAKFIANYEPSTEYATGAIGQRIDDAPERISGILDLVHPERDVAEGGALLQKGAKTRVGEAIKARRDVADPLYEAAKQKMPVIDTPEMGELLGHPDIAKVVQGLKERYPKKFGDLPDNHIVLLDRAKRVMDDDIKQLFRNGRSTEAGDLKELRKIFVEAIDDAGPEYQAARQAYQRMSPAVDRLKGNKEAKGILTDILKTDPVKSEDAARKLFQLSPTRITEVRDALGPERAQEFRAGVRSYMQSMADSTRLGRNAADRLQGSPISRAKLEAALGKDEAALLLKDLGREDTYARFHNLYNRGSDTAANLTEAENFGGMANAVSSIANALASPRYAAMNTLDKFVQRSAFKGKAPLAQDMAEIYFSNARGGDALEKIAGYLKELNRRHRGVDWATGGLQRGGARLGGIKAGED